jgi:hypothetical protein
VFLTNYALHSGGLSFLWIAFHIEGSYGYALDVMESCCFEGQCSCYDEKDVWLQQNLVSASKCKNIKR